MIPFKDLIHKNKLKNKATSNTKIRQAFSSLSLNDVGIHLREEPFSSDIGTVNLHPSKGTQWVVYIENFLTVMVVQLLKNYLSLL